MESENEHIKEFLTDYSKLNSPEYAVLISGDWGSGKTWFIKKEVLPNFEQSNKEKLYVSLYGVKSTSEIENELFRQLNPIRSNKFVQLVEKIFKDVIKIVVKVYAYVTINISSDLLPKILKIPKNTVLVFDDIERCSINNIVELLGYINRFVEHEKLKVILIVNENEILDKDKYEVIKEKLIGKNLKVQPNIKSALKHFITLMHENKKKFFTDNLDIITDIFKKSEYNNLRILKYTLLDFERILETLPTDIVGKEKLISEFLALYLAHSFEIRKGELKVCDIVSPMTIAISKHGNTEKTFEYDKQVISKYVSIDFHNLSVSREIWDDIFNRGNIPTTELHECLRNSQYFLEDNAIKQPSWIHLWYARKKSDDEFEEFLQDVEKKWLDFEYDDVGIVRHIAGIFFWLSSINLYQKNNDQILNHAKTFIDKLKNQRNDFFYREYNNAYIDESYVGLGFHGSEIREFLELSSYIKEKIKEAILESYVDKAKELVELMGSNTLEFCSNLDQSYDAGVVCRFRNIPILSFMNIEDFINVFISLSQDNRLKVSDVISRRYNNFASDLIKELEWLKNVTEQLKDIANQRTGNMSGYLIKSIAENDFELAIQELEKANNSF